MSVRQKQTPLPMGAYDQLRSDIVSVRSVETGLDFDSLSETEKSAATIGVTPDAWKPISFMNKAHYGELLRKNALSNRLTQQIESFKTVSGQ
tara:strand:- start:108 stop:383 length:276 start_codon:yes stop_codon:yes gene_type:complete